MTRDSNSANSFGGRVPLKPTLTVETIEIPLPTISFFTATPDVIEPGQFDFNDFYSNSEAGSPDLDSADYPVNQLNLLDSTCWSASGFQPQEMTGGCYKAPPQVKQKSAPVAPPI